ncbi:C4-dicarboxylate ABC transporter substrate-binding protein [Acuticoccus sediminis]|uniref:C4-dicarboxylate ABC transporter substrate-binding protein n=1 Tax=Acuticoccus sediminis TaxID=2184697 RepID=A0A8B2NU47_9HYPH|nr:TRAP transporter substrate-binding protein [Acuticoccus sediminis]RAI01004.1 C4-dicarboxylate ABC transporter substrate-binding protein [Acuticoccus sediminis]
MHKSRRLAVALLAATTLASVPALAQEIEPVTLAVVGSWSSLPLHKNYEKPFWTEALPEASADAITVELTTFDQMGVAGGDVYRLLGDGVFDVGTTVADYIVGDAPELEGLDVPLLATSVADAHKMVEAAWPMVADVVEDRFNAKLLTIAPYPPQVVFCKGEVKSLADLKGKKVRGSGRMTTKFLDALGAEGVNIAFGEVPGALERGVVDCAITGSGSGYSAGWWESADHLMTLPLGGWDPVISAMNLDKWNELPAATQELIASKAKSELETPAWDAAAAALEGDIACLTGSGECPLGEPASMTLVEPSAEDVATAEDVLKTVVLPDWAERAGPDAVARWNETVGKAVGVTIGE